MDVIICPSSYPYANYVLVSETLVTKVIQSTSVWLYVIW